MKYLSLIIIFIFVSFCSTQAQMDNYQLDFRAVVKSNDGVHKLILFHRGNTDDVIDGYILITRGNHNLEGRIKKNGFSFLDSKVFEVGIKSLRRTWVKNNFPLHDVTTLTNGVDVEKVYSFEITPVILNIKSDSLSFYIKGAFYNLTKQNKNKEYNLNYNIDLSYKLYKIPYNKTISLEFLNQKLKDYSCSIKFSKIKKSDEYLSIENNHPLLNGVKKSVSESEFPPSARFNLGVGFMRMNAASQHRQIVFSPSNFLLRVQQHSLVPVNSLLDKQYNNKVKLPVDVYHAELRFPFHLYNKAKSERYKNYKTKKEIFRSKYNIVVVPISLNDDTLTADVFLNYSKITLDNIPRWTPIKKRVKLIQGFPMVAIKLPKENWSANFTRDGEKYDIYGYSDYERYVNEYILISFNSIKTKEVTE